MYDELVSKLYDLADASKKDGKIKTYLDAASAIEYLSNLSFTWKRKYEDLLKVQRWIPVTEKLPGLHFEDGSDIGIAGWFSSDKVLILHNGEPEIGWYCVYSDDEFGWESEAGEIGEVTHWIPFPESPEVLYEP